jgi:Flp pilus assembly secretin CpaC
VRLKVLEVPRDDLDELGLSGTSGNEVESTICDAQLLKRIAQFQEAKRIQILAEPTLTTSSGRIARLNIGAEIPYPKDTDGGAITIGWQPIGTQVEILPAIKRNKRIDITIDTEISRAKDLPTIESQSGEIPPAIERVVSHATFDVVSGATVVFAGQADANGNVAGDRVVVFVATVEGPVRR